MPKINVYLPDDLAAAVRAAGFAVSPVCQQALADAVRTVGPARKVIEAIRRPDFDHSTFPQIANRLESRMTPRLRETVRLAREASGEWAPVATTHLLVGMLDEGENLGTRVLEALGVDLDELRAAALHADADEPIAPATLTATPASIPEAADPPGSASQTSWWGALTVPARLTLAAALEAAIDLGHNYLGCEHLLVGLVDHEESGAGRVLQNFGVERANLRRAVTSALAGFVQARSTSTGASTTNLDDIIRRLDAIEARLATAGV